MPLPSYAVAFAGPRHAVSLGPVSAFGLVNSDFTVEAWLRLDSTEGDSPVLGTDERRPNEGLHLSIREGRPYLGFYENDTAAPLRIGAGQWHHLAWRYSKEFGEQAIFLDGVAIARATGRLPFGGSGNLWVGRWGQRRWFHGAIADVRIWEEARSEASIAEAARGEDSPVGALCHLRSDGPALLPPGAAPKVDLSPLRVQGPQSLPPPPLLASPSLGLPASALRFAGGAWLGLVYAPTLGITLGDFTASAWIRLRAVGRGDQVILGGRTAKPRRGLHLSIRDGKPYFGFYASDLAGRRKLEAERWTHVSWRYSALAQRMDIFVDGAPDSSASPRPPYLGNGMLDIGRFPGRRDLYADLATLRVWRSALTEEQLRAEAAGEATGADAALVAAWEVDEAGRFDDRSGLDNEATRTGSFSVVEGPKSAFLEALQPEPPAGGGEPRSNDTSASPAPAPAPASGGEPRSGDTSASPAPAPAPASEPGDPVERCLYRVATAQGPLPITRLVSADSVSFFQAFPSAIALESVEARREQDGLLITGRSSLFDSRAEVELALDSSLRPLRVAVLLGADFHFRILPFLALERVGLRWERGSGTLSGIVVAGSESVAFTLPLPLPEEELVLQLAGPETLAGIDALAALIGGGEVLGLLASGLEAGRALGLQKLDLRVAPDGFRAVELLFATQAVWTVVPEVLAVGQLRVEMQVQRPLDPRARSLYGSIQGVLSLGSAAIPLSFGRKPGQGSWRLGLPADQQIALPSLAALVEGLGLPTAALPEGLGSLAITLTDVGAELDLGRKKVRKLSVAFQSSAAWSVLGIEVTRLEATLGVEDPGLRPLRMQGVISGQLHWGGADFAVTATRGESWEFAGSLQEGSRLSLGGLVESLLPGGVEVPDGLDAMAITAAELEADEGTGGLRMYARLEGSWSLDLGPSGVELQQLLLRVERASRNVPPTFTISGVLEVDGVPVRLYAALSKGAWSLRGEADRLNLGRLLDGLCDAAELAGIPVPGGSLDLELRDVRLRLAPGSLSLRAACDAFPLVGVAVARNSSGKWGAHLVLRPGDGWQLSRIDGVLAPLDGLDLTGSLLLMSSAGGSQVAFAEVPEIPAFLAERGMVVWVWMGLGGTGLDRLTGLQTVEARVAIGMDPRSTVIQAALGGDLSLGGGVELIQPRLELRLQPPSFALAVALTVRVTLSDSVLNFIGAMAVSPSGAVFSATMLGSWKRPFGLGGVEVADVALELGINFGGIPSVGLAGTLRIGEDAGHLAVKFDSTQPSRSMLAVGFTRLRPYALLLTVCEAVVAVSLPPALRELADQVEFSDCELYVVPEPTRIGALQFEPGTRVKGGIRILGYGGRASAEVAPSGGIHITGSLDAIRIGSVFGITSADGSTGPWLDVDLRPGARPSGRFSGKAWLLGLSSLVEVEVTPTRQRLHLDSRSGITHYVLDVDLSPSGLAARGAARFAVKADIGPFSFRVPILPRIDLDFLDPIWSGAAIPALGFEVQPVPNIHLDFGFEGAFSLSASKELFALGLAGGLWWDGHSLNMPDLQLSVAPEDLAKLPEILVNHIADHAEEIFARLFAVVEDFGAMLLREAEAVARKAWKEVSDFGAEVGRQLARLGEEIAAIAAYAAAEVARLGEAAARAVAELGAEAGRYAAEAAAEVARLGEQAAREVAAIAAEAGRLAASLASEAVALANAAAVTAQQVLDEAAATVSRIGSEATAAVSAVASAGEAAARAVADQARAVAAGAEAAANTVRAGFEDAAGTTASFATSSANAVAQQGESLGRFAASAGGEVRDGVVWVGGQVVSGLSTGGNAIVNGAEYVGGKIVGGLEDAGRGIVDTFDPSGW